MEALHHFLDFFMHLDVHLGEWISNSVPQTYLILFAIIFVETGVVIWPFLPGDSLLFAVGAISANGSLNIFLVYLLLTAAALLGDNCNYWIGRFFGPKVFGKLLSKKYLDDTHQFYEKHGVLAVVIAQFAPIIRTFAPFVAGVGKMTYSKFALLNLIGVLSWTTLFLGAGYFFGNLDFVKQNFHYVIFGIIGVSLIPIALQVLKGFTGSSKTTKKAPAKKKK
jgi:membrane-associated protein